MADVTISALTNGVPAGSNIVPYSTGSVTLGAPVSAMFHGTNKVYFNASNDGVTSFQHLITGATSASFIMADNANKAYSGPGDLNNTNNPPLLELRGTGFNFSEPKINFTEKGNVLGSIIVKNYAGNTGTFHFCTNNTNFAANSAVPRMTISANGNVGIGTTNAKSTITTQGSERIIAADAASEYEQDRYFTFKKHYSLKNVTNSAYTRLIQFRPYLNGTTNYPTGTNFWTRVGVNIRTGGHTSSVGNGDRSFIGSFDYVGNGIGSVVTLQDLQQGSIPLLNLTFSGWEAYIDIKGATGPGGSLGGYCYIELNFGSGEGNFGESIVWNLTEYY
jgi:hypothetical protein